MVLFQCSKLHLICYLQLWVMFAIWSIEPLHNLNIVMFTEGFQKPATQDLKNLKENNTFSPETEDNFTSQSGTGMYLTLK